MKYFNIFGSILIFFCLFDMNYWDKYNQKREKLLLENKVHT